MFRMWMKSNSPGRYVQSSLQSSISNLTLGGTQSGCVGERSVPVTEAEGNWSAKSMAQMPVPVPISSTRWGGR